MRCVDVRVGGRWEEDSILCGCGFRVLVGTDYMATECYLRRQTSTCDRYKRTVGVFDDGQLLLH